MKKSKYPEIPSYVLAHSDEYGDDPGNRLREALRGLAPGLISADRNTFEELLYTARERNILSDEDGFSLANISVLVGLLKLAEITDIDVSMYRM